MVTIREEDLIESVADALQFISYYHPMDYIRALGAAYEAEQGPAAKDAIAQILTNSRMCAEGKRPICQDTGIVNVFLKIGMDVRWEGFKGSIADAVNDGVRKGYLNPDNVLRASVLDDPLFARLERLLPGQREHAPVVVAVPAVGLLGAVASEIDAVQGEHAVVGLREVRHPQHRGHGSGGGRHQTPQAFL